MSDLLGVFAIAVPCLAMALFFGLKARQSEGLDRRKYMVGLAMFLLAGVFASLVAWLLVSVGPPGA